MNQKVTFIHLARFLIRKSNVLTELLTGPISQISKIRMHKDSMLLYFLHVNQILENGREHVNFRNWHEERDLPPSLDREDLLKGLQLEETFHSEG